MPEINVEFENMPEELVPTVQKLHKKFQHFVPKWVQTITYQFRSHKADEEGTVAENYTSYPYRRVVINVFSNFIISKGKYREEVFVHEMMHTFSGIFTIPVFDIVGRLIKDEDTREIILDELVEKVESFTQDIAWCILNYCRYVEANSPTTAKLKK